MSTNCVGSTSYNQSVATNIIYRCEQGSDHPTECSLTMGHSRSINGLKEFSPMSRQVSKNHPEGIGFTQFPMDEVMTSN